MKNNPLFTVITVCYNSQKTIKNTIESLLFQSFNDFEFIIIDGNSSDDTFEIIKSFDLKFKEKGIVYKYISEPDKGIYDAWNKGVKMSSGTWLSFIGSDDFYLNNALELYYTQIIDLDDDINFISSKVELIDSNFKKIREIGKKYSSKTIINKMSIAQIGSFHKRILFEEIGLFNINYTIAGDFDFYIRGRNIIKPVFLNIITAKMMDGGVSNNSFKALKEGAEIKINLNVSSVFSVKKEFYLSYIKCQIKKVIGI